MGILSGIAGFYLSYYLDGPSGASIVLTMSAPFALVFIAKSLWLTLAFKANEASAKIQNP
ncbi:MAG: metal ABC transporter permease [Anaerolineae bacterium]|nr:metal ABC transporter permease [Anaerolineae bacterium]MCA9894163.1 metal ABC transporter permease [Anaerolineae bacterium]